MFYRLQPALARNKNSQSTPYPPPNSSGMNTYEKQGEGGTLSRTSRPLFSTPTFFRERCSFLDSFLPRAISARGAVRGNSSPYFSTASALFAKNTGVYPNCLPSETAIRQRQTGRSFSPDGAGHILPTSATIKGLVLLNLSSAGTDMALKCELCGKGPHYGNVVSHANNTRRRRWNPNLKRVRAVVAGAHKHLRVCTACIRAGKVTKVGAARAPKAA